SRAVRRPGAGDAVRDGPREPPRHRPSGAARAGAGSPGRRLDGLGDARDQRAWDAAPVSDVNEERLRAHPELASLLALATQLDLLPTVFAAIHGPKQRDALSDQARSMSRVSRILADQ